MLDPSRSFCISGELYKKIASLRYPALELVLREEKSVTTAVRFDWDLRPAASGRFEEKDCSTLKSSLRNQRWPLLLSPHYNLTATAASFRLESDCICLPTFTVSYLYQKFSGKINLAYIIVVLGHRLTGTSATFDFVRVRTSYRFCVCLLRLLYAVDIVLGLGL